MTQLLGRDTEIARVHEAVAGARTGRPTALLVAGPAGIGKTALVDHVITLQPSASTAVAKVAADATRARVPFAAARSLLAPLVQQAADTAGPEALFTGAAALAAPIFSGAAPGGDRGDLFSRVHGLTWLTARLAERLPLVFWVDDVHLLDPPSARFLGHLARHLVDLPVSLVASYRTAPGGAASPEVDELAAHADRLDVAPLDATAVAALLGPQASPELAERILAATGGVPLLVRAAAARLADAGTGEAGALDAEILGSLARERLAALSAPAGAVARALAIRESAPLPELAAIAEVDAGVAEIALRELSDARLVDDAAPPRFVHAVVHDAIRDGIDDLGREQLHRRVATQLARAGDPESAAAHLLRAGEGAFDGAEHRVLMLAAARARSLGAVDEAAALLRRARTAASTADEQHAAASMLGAILAEARDPEGIELLRAAHAAEQDPGRRADAALALGHALFWNARFEESGAVCREAAASTTDRELALLLEAEAVSGELLRGVERSRPATFEPAVDAGTTVGERALLVHVAGDLAARGTRSATEIGAMVRRAVDDGVLLGRTGPASPMLAFAVTTAVWAEDFDTALELVAWGDELARRRGSRVGVAYASALRAGVRQRLGDLRGCIHDARLVLDEYPAEDPLATMSALAFLIEALVDQDDHAAAAQLIDASGLGGPLPVLGTVDFLLLARGWLRVQQGDAPLGLADLREVASRAQRAEYLNPAGLAWRSRTALALASAAEHASEEAAALAMDEVERARAFGAPRALGVALRAAALVGDPAARVDALSEACTVLAGSRARLEEARARIDLGCALHAAGRTPDAQQHLREGMTMAHVCGATREAERAASALRATGARPRRPAVQGVDALTSHELACAELAAAGSSNRDIAERQFVTLRTVEQHLSKAYRKLGISRRSELAAALASSPRPS